MIPDSTPHGEVDRSALRRFKWGLLVGVIPLMFIGGPLEAQDVSEDDLSRPEPVLPNRGFTHVVGVSEFSDGRVLIADAGEPSITVLHSEGADTTRVGREGQGPEEYLVPTAVVTLAGDRMGIIDRGNDRLLVIGPTATPEGTVPLRRAGSCRRGGSGWQAPARAVDLRGYFYAEVRAVGGSAGGGMKVADSFPIERWMPGTCGVDTVLHLPTVEGSGGTVVGASVVGGRVPGPFDTSSQWAVAPDGRVAAVYPDPYHVEVVTPEGERVVGPRVDHRPIRVTEAHKERWREMQSAPRLARTRARGDGEARWAFMVMPPFPEPARWPDVLPPFLDDSAAFAPNGTLWVRRTTRIGDPTTFDIFSGRGILIRRVKLPPGRRLAGFGDGTVYVVRTNEVDLQFLERYVLSGGQ